MINIIQILFSNVIAEAEGGKGSPISFTLILILIIAILVTVLLIRDKKIREKVKGVFQLIGKKIKNSRINSKIEKEEKGLVELIVNLGSNGYENSLFPDNTEEIIDKIKKEKAIVGKFESAIDNTEAKIEKLKSEHEIFTSLKRSEVEMEYKVKEPAAIKHKEGSRILSDLKKESDENEKKIIKIGKGIDKAEAELERLSKDGLLDPEEREGRKEREEKSLIELKQELSDRTIKEASMPGKLSIIEKEENGLRSELDVIEKKIEIQETELKEAEKEHENKIAELVKEKGHFAAEKAKSNIILKAVYEDLGKIFDKERPDNKDLSVIYIDIDRARERIKNLRSQLQ